MQSAKSDRIQVALGLRHGGGRSGSGPVMPTLEELTHEIIEQRTLPADESYVAQARSTLGIICKHTVEPLIQDRPHKLPAPVRSPTPSNPLVPPSPNPNKTPSCGVDCASAPPRDRWRGRFNTIAAAASMHSFTAACASCRPADRIPQLPASATLHVPRLKLPPPISRRLPWLKSDHCMDTHTRLQRHCHVHGQVMPCHRAAVSYINVIW